MSSKCLFNPGDVIQLKDYTNMPLLVYKNDRSNNCYTLINLKDKQFEYRVTIYIDGHYKKIGEMDLKVFKVLYA